MARTTVYNPVVDEKLYEKVHNENKELLKEFIEYCQGTGKSEGTITGYTSDIKICYMWNLENNNNKFFVDFNKRDFLRYQNYLLNTLKVSSSRIRRLRAAISSMSNYIENMMDDVYTNYRNIVNKIEAPAKQPVREKTILTDEQVQQLLDNLVENKQYQRACVLALAWASGARKSELLRFKPEYFKDENIKYGSLYKTPEKIKTKGRGGKMIHKYVIVNKFKPYFDLWMKQREELKVDIEDLFVIKREDKWESMKVSTLDSWANIFSKCLNVDFYFHSLRHNFTTELSKAGVPASVIKDIVGWENISMVSIYDDQEVDDKLGDFFDENGVRQVENKTLSDL